MLRSLFAGVTGLANHQLKLDVIGNNIANINTLGFKASRVTFREMLTQTIRGASRPSEGTGGTNPQQIGLGSSVGSIDTNFSQGNMQITGIMTDLAIEGKGFFIMSDGYTQYYTRGGAFSLDGLGYMVNPGNGYKLQGIIADSYGNIQQGQGVEDIMIPTSLIVPARATSEIEIDGNLPSTVEPQATITRTGTFMAAADGTDDLLELFSGNDRSIGLNLNDAITIQANVGGTVVEGEYLVTSTSSLQALVSAIQSALRQGDPAAAVQINSVGAIEVTAGTMGIDDLQIFVDGSYQFNEEFFSIPDIAAGSTQAANNALRTYATTEDLLADLYVNGSRLDITDGYLEVDGDVGAQDMDNEGFDVNVGATTLGDLTALMETVFDLPAGNVEVDGRGRIVVTGAVGESFEIANIDVIQDGDSLSAFTFTPIQNAGDGTDFNMTSIIYDSLGNTHNLSLIFTKVPDENVWNWQAEVDGVAQITDGASGVARFTEGGLLSSFTTNGASGRIEINFGNGSENSSVILDAGEIGSTNSLSQFNSAFSVRMNDVDGMGMGILQTISIDRNGIINGQFSNGTNRDLAQIAMADFNNPSGLNRVGENMFIFSPNSGTANLVFAGTNARGMISPGELEMSNVDLAGEFTEMIVAQRGFQANARIISVGDQMLTELVNLKK